MNSVDVAPHYPEIATPTRVWALRVCRDVCYRREAQRRMTYLHSVPTGAEAPSDVVRGHRARYLSHSEAEESINRATKHLPYPSRISAISLSSQRSLIK